MKKLFLFAALLASTSSFAEFTECTLETHLPSFESSIKYGLSQIDPTLDLSTLKIQQGAETNYFGIPHHEYKVMVQNKFGNTFYLATYTAERQTNELVKKVGGLIVSDPMINYLQDTDGKVTPYKCESQYLSFTSFWFKGKTYAIRLVDQNGFAINTEDADIFDRLLRAGSFYMNGPLR